MNKIEYIEFMDSKGKPLLNPGRGYEGFNKISYLLVYLSNHVTRWENKGMRSLEQAGFEERERERVRNCQKQMRS